MTGQFQLWDLKKIFLQLKGFKKHGKILTIQFLHAKIVHHGSPLNIKLRNFIILIQVETHTFAFHHIHFKEKLNLIHSLLQDKYIIGIKQMENYLLLTHLKFSMPMINLFKIVNLSINLLKNNANKEEFKLNMESNYLKSINKIKF